MKDSAIANFATKFNEKYSYGAYDIFNDGNYRRIIAGMDIKIENNRIVYVEILIKQQYISDEIGRNYQRIFIFTSTISKCNGTQVILPAVG